MKIDEVRDRQVRAITEVGRATIEGKDRGTPADVAARVAPPVVLTDAPTNRFPLIELLDITPVPMGLTDALGNMKFANAALRDLLCDDADHTEHRIALAAQARALSGLTDGKCSTTSEVSVDVSFAAVVGCWRFHARLLPSTMPAPPGSSVLVCAERTGITRERLDTVRAQYGLTDREAQVTAHITLGQTSRRIATILGISMHTVRRHTESVLRKLGAHSRVEALLLIAGA